MGTKSSCTKGWILLFLILILIFSNINFQYLHACFLSPTVVNIVEFAGISYTAQSYTDL